MIRAILDRVAKRVSEAYKVRKANAAKLENAGLREWQAPPVLMEHQDLLVRQALKVSQELHPITEKSSKTHSKPLTKD